MIVFTWVTEHPVLTFGLGATLIYVVHTAKESRDLEEKLDKLLEVQSSDDREVEIQPVEAQERDTE